MATGNGFTVMVNVVGTPVQMPLCEIKLPNECGAKPTPTFVVTAFVAVLITDTSFVSSGTIASWYYNFGDGTTLTRNSNTPFYHTYNTAGNYRIKLVTTTNNNCHRHSHHDGNTTYADAVMNGGSLYDSMTHLAMNTPRKQEETLGAVVPEENNNKTIGETGLFIPEQWSMPPYIDKFGNSLVEEALEAIHEERKQWKKDLSPEQYQLRISQKPTNIEEAFATRKESVFPPHLLSHQSKRIEEGVYPVEYLDLRYDADGKVEAKTSNKRPINRFPVDKTMEDKSGVICVYERPIKNVPWGTYYASIDPVGEGKTTTSDSLCSIFVYKTATEVIKDDGQGKISTHFERDAIVASWCGRFDDLQKTHERLELIVEWYNAWTLCENNVSLFIQYMISRRKQKYLVPKDQIPFLKELSSNANVYATYGWKNTGVLFKQHLLSYGIQFLTEEIDKDMDENGETKKIYYGVERIPDPMLLEEMKQYQPGVNVDRLVSFCALVAFAQIQQNNRGLAKRVEITSDKLVNSQKLSKLSMRSAFRNMGVNSKSLNFKPNRNPFKNIK